MNQKQLAKGKGILLALLCLMSAVSIQAVNVIPYLSPLQSFGGTSANLSTFTPIEGDYTLEVQGTVGNPISVAGGVYTYTPTTNGTVRFSQKNGKVYVYEGSVYMTTLTPTLTINYPTITNADAATNSSNLLQNASFETLGTLVAGTAGTTSAKYTFASPWATSVTINATTNSIRVGMLSGSAVNGSYACIWRGSGNSDYFYQPINTTIKPGTSYKVIVYESLGGNAYAYFNIGLGSTVNGMEYDNKVLQLGNTKLGSFSTILHTPQNVSGTSYFTFKNTAANTANSGSDPLAQFDYIALVEGSVSVTTPGITGVSSATYYSGTAYAPENVAIDFVSGDVYDMTQFIVNPSFEALQITGLVTYPGWANANNDVKTQSNIPGAGWTKDGNMYVEKYVAQTSNLTAASITQTINNVPSGMYRLTATAHAIKQSNTSLVTTGADIFLNTSNTAVVNTGATYTVDNVSVTSGTINLGFELKGTITSNWAGVDNFKLFYLGNALLTTSVPTLNLTNDIPAKTFDLTGSSLLRDITLTVPSNVTLSGSNVTGSSPTYTIPLASANQTNTITVTWVNTAVNASGSIGITSGLTACSVAVASSDVESATFSNIALSAGSLSPVFASGTYSYSIPKQPADVTGITLTGIPTSSVASITNNGAVLNSGNTSATLGCTSYNTLNHNDYTVSWTTGNYAFTDWALGTSTDALLSIPSVSGWSANPAVTWIAANGTTTGTCRLIDITGGLNATAAAGVTYTYGGNNYDGRILLTRWDGNAGRIFSYPVTLQAGTVYQITGKAASHNGAATLTFGVNSTKSSTSPIASGTVTTTTNGLLFDFAVINISVPTTGVYYLNITSSAQVLSAIADLTLNSQISNTFTGAVDNTWGNASNWSGSRVPLAGDDVTLSSGTLTIDKNAYARNIDLAPGSSLTLSTGKTLTASNLTIESDATGTGSFVDNGTSTITSGVVKQYLAGRFDETNTLKGRMWYVAVPVTGIYSSAFSVAAALPANKLWSHSEGRLGTDNGYVQITTIDSLLAVGKGYVARMNGNNTLSFTGVPFTGNKVVTVSSTGTTNAKRGYNLVGNPYPSWIDWTGVVKSNVANDYWTRSYNSVGNVMVFDSYNGASGDCTVNGSSGTMNKYIAPMQAFWVKCTAVEGNGTLSYTNAVRSNQTLLQLRQATDAAKVRLQVSNGLISDETLIGFYPNAVDALDLYDTYKMSNSDVNIPEIYTMVGKDEMTINGMAPIANSKELALGFRTGKAGTFTLKATELVNLEEGSKVILKDRALNTVQDLTVAPEYTFTSDATTTLDRFSILISKVATNLNTTSKASAGVFATENGSIQVDVVGLGNQQANIVVHNALGQLISTSKTNAASTTLNTRLKPGIYLVTVSAVGFQTTQKVVINK